MLGPSKPEGHQSAFRGATGACEAQEPVGLAPEGSHLKRRALSFIIHRFYKVQNESFIKKNISRKSYYANF